MAQPNSTGADGDTLIIFLVLATAIIGYLIYTFLWDKIVFGAAYIGLLEAKLWYSFDALRGLIPNDIDAAVRAIAKDMQAGVVHKTFGLWGVVRTFGFFVYPVAALIAFWAIAVAYIVRFHHPTKMYVRLHNLDSVLTQQSKIFPEVRPVLGLGRLLTNSKTFFRGAWRLADSPLLFAMRNHLLYVPLGEKKNEHEAPARRYLTIKAVDVPDVAFGDQEPHLHAFEANLEKGYEEIAGVLPHAEAKENWMLDLDRARAVFEKQLGASLFFDGHHIQPKACLKLPAQHRVLVAAFLLFRLASAKDNKESAKKVLDACNNAFANPKGLDDFSVEKLFVVNKKTGEKRLAGCADEVIRHYLLGDDSKEVVDALDAFGIETFDVASADGKRRVALAQNVWYRTGFANTYLFKMLDFARERGIVTTAEFIWLRPIDRTLFYALNNCGRHNPKNATGFVEGAGVVAHAQAEYAHGDALPFPVIEEAVIGLSDALYNEGWCKHTERKLTTELAG